MGPETVATEQWMQSVDKSICCLQKAADTQAQAMSVMQDGMQQHTEQLRAITEATQPMIEALQTMQAGIRTIGTVGHAGAKVANIGWKIAKLGGFFIASWMFFKSIVLGQPISSAWADFWRFIK